MPSLNKKEFVAEVEKSRVECQICGFKAYSLVLHIKDTHDITPIEYAKQFPQKRITSPIIAHFMQRFKRNPLDGPIEEYLNHFKSLPGTTDEIISEYKSKDLGDYTCPENLEHLIPEEDEHYSFQSAPLRALIASMKIKKNLFFSGPTGCVDADTEYLSPTGWERISDYSPGTKVGQYNLDGTMSFVTPLNYIKRPTRGLWRFKTKYGLDQCLTEDHRVLYKTSRGYYKVKLFSEVKKEHYNNKRGFSGKFITTFLPTVVGSFVISNANLRLQVAVIADGHLHGKKCVINVKKERKIESLRFLLKESEIEYTEDTKDNGYVRFTFIPPMMVKEYTDIFWKCDSEQLKIINDEIVYWDGDQKNRFSTMSKKSADFIQYVFSSCGYRSTINTIDRTKDGKGVEYSVDRNTRTEITMEKDRKTEITKYEGDGYDYCFEVPSSYLVLRRNNKIFITGNCGKTQLILQTFNRLGRPIHRMNMDASVTPSTFIGRRSLDNGSTGYDYGFLPLAMKHGYPMLIDEIDFTPPPIASRLFPVLESHNPTLVIPETNEVIKAAPGFMVFGTGNTGGRGDMFGQYVGTEVQNIAYLGRFSMNVEMEYLDRKIEIDMLTNRFPDIMPTAIESMVDCANEMRQAFINNDLNTPLSTRRMVELFEILPLLGVEEGMRNTIINWYGDESERSLIEEIFSRKDLRKNLEKAFGNG